MLVQMLKDGNYVPIVQSADLVALMEDADRIAKRQHTDKGYRLIGETHSDVLAIGVSKVVETKKGLGILWSWKD